MPKPPSRSSSGEIAQFLNTSRAITEVSRRQPRLLFGIDATASRQPTWDSACHLQHTMFQATRDIATLAIQLAYYRGLNEFHYTRWLTDTQALAQQMSAVSCLGGHTQIARLLRHALAQHRDQPVRAWCLSAMPWKSPPLLCVTWRGNVHCASYPCSCSRRGTTSTQNTPCAP
jgi:hypothetical protein